MNKLKSYEELSKLKSFEERFNYLKLYDNFVGEDVFGGRRFLNQKVYRSKEWKNLRKYIITRDNGCDLGVAGYDIYDSIYIHHINPITKEDVMVWSPDIFDPNFLICVSFDTHNAIHFGNDCNLNISPTIRKPNDTVPWKG